MSGAPSTARKSPYECHPSQVHMFMRRQVATGKGTVETIHKLTIITTFAYLLPTSTKAITPFLGCYCPLNIIYFFFISDILIESCQRSDIAHLQIIDCMFHMLAFRQDNDLCQLTLSFASLKLLKLARGLLMDLMKIYLAFTSFLFFA